MIISLGIAGDYFPRLLVIISLIVAGDYFTKAADYEAALVGTYDVLQWNIYSVMIGDLATANSLCGGESATDVIGLQKIDDMIHNLNLSIRKHPPDIAILNVGENDIFY